MKIGGRSIESGRPPYVIAEVGVNHDGDLQQAYRLIEAAGASGADAVKFQYFETDLLMSGASRLAAYQRRAGETDPLAMLRRLELTIDELAACIECARANGLHAIVSVFSVDLVGRAAGLDWDAFKTASPDVVHRPLLERLGETGKPLVVSTGAATAEEAARARGWLERCKDRVAFLHCVSAYPAAASSAHVAACAHVAELVTPCPVGYSDHTSEVETGFVAARHGATILEKHITLDRTLAGPDHEASLDPEGFKQYVWWSRLTAREAHDAYYDEALVGDAEKRVHDVEADVRDASRQSIVTRREIQAGEVIGLADCTFKRPGTGIEPWRIDEVVGSRAACRLEADAPIGAADVIGA